MCSCKLNDFYNSHRKFQWMSVVFFSSYDRNKECLYVISIFNYSFGNAHMLNTY